MADDFDVQQESLITNFISVTGVDRERAIFFLQSSAWNLEASMGAFYDDENPGVEEELVSTQESQAAPQLEPPINTSKPTAQGRGGVATLSDYREKPSVPQPGKEDAQQFFAGGSEHSGQMIEGPPREKKTPDSLAKEVFEAAKRQGAVPVEEEEREQKKQRSSAFQGTGFRLGDIEGPSQSGGNGAPPSPRQEKLRHTLTFWKDGFSVDDGPLRSGETEEDKKFIDSVRKGEIPQELTRGARRGEVDVDVDIRDKRAELYVQPKPKVVAFSGAGRKLGSYAPEVKSSPECKTTLSSSSSLSSSSVDPPSVPLDPSQPTTSIQIRLADGSRLVAKFNHSHTINDIRQFINLSRPSSLNYVLLTTFPNKELSDPTLTISQAQLLNAVIVQRIR